MYKVIEKISHLSLILILVFIIYSLMGCKSPRQRLTELRAKYPCRETGRVDTVTSVVIDSIPYFIQGKMIEVKADCPASPTPSVQKVYFTTEGDTVYLKGEIRTVVRKEYYEDELRIDSMRAEVFKANLTNTGIVYQKDKSITQFETLFSNWVILLSF